MNATHSQISKEKKHDMAWVVVQILMRWSAVLVAVYTVAFIVVRIFFLKNGITLSQFLMNNKGMYQLIMFVLFPISYLGIHSGCKYVLSKTFIAEKDFFKIGYWVGLIPIFFNLLGLTFVGSSVIFGVFVTPSLVKRWLIQFNKVKNS